MSTPLSQKEFRQLVLAESQKGYDAHQQMMSEAHRGFTNAQITQRLINDAVSANLAATQQAVLEECRKNGGLITVKFPTGITDDLQQAYSETMAKALGYNFSADVYKPSLSAEARWVIEWNLPSFKMPD